MEDRAKVVVLLPLIPLSAIGTGFLIHLVSPIPIATAAVTMPVGIFLVVVSIMLVVAAARELAKAHTAFDVRKPTTCLVRGGVFRLSRNPVYFSMLLLCVGIALLANSVALWLFRSPRDLRFACWSSGRRSATWSRNSAARNVSSLQIISPSVDLMTRPRGLTGWS